MYTVSTGSNLLSMGTLLSSHRHDLDQVATFSEILASLKVGGTSVTSFMIHDILDQVFFMFHNRTTPGP